MTPCQLCGTMHAPTCACDTTTKPEPYVAPTAADRRGPAHRAHRALAALSVLEAALQAAWPAVLDGLDSVPASEAANRCSVYMFDVERKFKEIRAFLRSKT